MSTRHDEREEPGERVPNALKCTVCGALWQSEPVRQLLAVDGQCLVCGGQVEPAG